MFAVFGGYVVEGVVVGGAKKECGCGSGEAEVRGAGSSNCFVGPLKNKNWS